MILFVAVIKRGVKMSFDVFSAFVGGIFCCYAMYFWLYKPFRNRKFRGLKPKFTIQVLLFSLVIGLYFGNKNNHSLQNMILIIGGFVIMLFLWLLFILPLIKEK